MAFGLGVLRLPANLFWTMTPREIARAAEGHYGRSNDEPITRERLDDMMLAWPDGGNA